jgi:cellulose synthase/poly-beta-1,6-N-acetylglucosamine synthase-like glycosyltransferase
MLITVILFWLSLSVLFFCLFLFLFNQIKGVKHRQDDDKRSTEDIPVTIIIAAYNEGAVLDQKIQNTLAIDYPNDKLTIIVVTDGSTDGSEAIIHKYPSVLLLHQVTRQGKLAAVKRAMQQVKTPVVVFSDANAMLNKECIKKIVAHYSDPKTGGVAGEKKIISDSGQSAVGDAEGLYWKYESFMKKQDAGFNTVVGAAGELFSIRTDLFVPLDDHIILDDFLISMQVCLQGYKIKYEPDAYASELPSSSMAEEAKRKTRISSGAYQSIGYLKSALNFSKYPALAFQYISRRLFRWVLCPLMLIILLITNILIIIQTDSSFIYRFVFTGQLFFYLAAMCGWLIIRSGNRLGVFTIPFYFVFMNYCLIRGFFRFVGGRQTVLWEKSERNEVGDQKSEV